MLDNGEPCLLQHEHAALLARAQLYRVEAEEAAAAMASIKSLSSSPGKSHVEPSEIGRLHAELARAASSNAVLRTELTILRQSPDQAGAQRADKSMVEDPPKLQTSCTSRGSEDQLQQPSPEGSDVQLQPQITGSSEACCSNSRVSEGDPAAQQPSDPWSARMKDWKSSLERFRRDTQSSQNVVAYARRLGSAAGVRSDQAREHSLESRLEAQERELLVAG